MDDKTTQSRQPYKKGELASAMWVLLDWYGANVLLSLWNTELSELRTCSKGH